MEFVPWPKISRFDSPFTITEKIDGTNSCVVIADGLANEGGVLTVESSPPMRVAAQSRNRMITPEQDNYGFAKWVYANAEALAAILGPGYHFGEWYGAGIQRRYGLDKKYFALFNTERWWGFNDGGPLYDIGVRHVPIIQEGENFTFDALTSALEKLEHNGGSFVNREFNRPEGVVIHFKHNRTNFKYILDK